MRSVEEIHVGKDMHLILRYHPEIYRLVDIKPLLQPNELELLRDPYILSQVYVDDSGEVAWPNGIKLNADWLYESSAPIRRPPTAEERKQNWRRDFALSKQLWDKTYIKVSRRTYRWRCSTEKDDEQHDN